MLKRTLFFTFVIILALNGNRVLASYPSWQISVEQSSFSLYKKYSSDPQYVINDNLNQAISVGYIDYPQKDKLQSFLKNLFSVALVFRLGKTNLGFDWDYGAEHEKSNISDNVFWGYGAIINYKWNESWGTSFKALLDYGKIENKSITRSSVRSGYVYARKANGSWDSSTADIEITYEQNNRVYSFGLLAPMSKYGITYSDTPGYPATYEKTDSFSASQAYVYAGIRSPVIGRANLLLKVAYPLGKASGIGYLVNLDYEF